MRPIGEIIGHIEREQKDETGEQLNLIKQVRKVYHRITKGLEPFIMKEIKPYLPKNADSDDFF